MRADGIGTVSGRLFVGTAEKISPSELIDTTGAGDAFIGAVLYGKLTISSKMLIYLRFQCVHIFFHPLQTFLSLHWFILSFE